MRLAYDWRFYFKIMTNTNQQLEIWKDIPNYEGFYQASTLGRIKSLNFKRTGKEGVLKDNFDKKGYSGVRIFKDKKGKSFKVHKLIAMTFLGHVPCGYKKIVDHKDNNPSNNNVDNLQIITQRRNASKDKDLNKKTSKYTGVFWLKDKKIWTSKIRINGSIKHLGHFKNEQDASDCYNQAVIDFELGKEIKVHYQKTKGYTWHKASKKWYAQLCFEGKIKYLGLFASEEEASKAYQKALKEHNENSK